MATGLVVGLVGWLSARGGPSLRKLGYKRQSDGTYTRVVGELRVLYRKSGRWSVRTGLYASTDFVAEPKTGRPPGQYAFACGVEALDARFWFWSERPPYARPLLGELAVQRAMLAFPPGAVIALHGDELTVKVERRRWDDHDRVVRLARAIVACSGPATG